jgi:hypothetical protein
MRRAKMGWRTFGALALGVLVASGRPAVAGEKIKQGLMPVADADARGLTRLVLKASDNGRFEVQVRNLDANTTYEILVGGVRVGTLSTKGAGSGSARFRSLPHGHDQLLGFDPRGQIVTVRSAAGADVLVGTMPPGSTASSPDKVVCCIPDDRGSECEDRTADECTAQGGTVSIATSCLPNPCTDAPAVDVDIVCCLPDDSGPECEDRTAAECAAQGGMAVEATSCNPNPCAATPPADADTRCCLPDDKAAECEDRTPAQCIALGGIDMGAGSCTPNPCAGAANEPGQPGGGDNGGHGELRALRAIARSVDDRRGRGRGADNPVGDDRGQ